MKTLANNRELYEYLVFLASELKRRGADSLSRDVIFAIGQASGLSTEFLGEPRLALRRVSNQENGVLTDEQSSDLLDVLRQLDEAFDKRE